MPLPVFQKLSGLKPSIGDEYDAATGDPQFVYHFWFRRPRYLILFLQSADTGLDPRVYVNRGNGFDERTSLALEYVGPSVYVLNVSEPRHVKTIRFDPCTFETRLRYRAAFAWTDADRDALIARAKAMAPGKAQLYDLSLDGTPEKRRWNRRAWNAEHYASIVELAERTAPPVHLSQVQDGPFISFVVPTFNTPPRYLDDLLGSFQLQSEGSAELIMSDDGSSADETLAWLSRHKETSNVRIVRSERNGGIAVATNAGIAAARGEWVGLLDHDDALSPATVQLLAQTAREHPDCQFIYTDEVVTDAKLRVSDFHLKPAYDEVLLSGVNYINHLSCYRRARLAAVGGMREGYEGSQDYDLLLRYMRDLSPKQIKHLPYPAYRWRRNAKSFSTQFLDRSTAHARKALAEHYGRSGSSVAVDEALTAILHRVRFDKQIAQWPRVSVVIPNRDSFALIARVIADLKTRTNYPDLEIIVVDNGSTDPKVLDLYGRTGKDNPRFRFEIEPGPFNFSRQVNRGIALASGEFVLLLNNDVQVLEPDWLREMVSCFEYRGTGIVGTRLLYPSKRIQHAGVIVGLGGAAGHWFLGQTMRFKGPMGRLHLRQSLTAVTGACMLISRACLNAIGGFDEQELRVAYNDIDFCLRAAAKGFRVVWTPFATLVHHESATRGSDTTRANRGRFQSEQDVLRQRHGTEDFEDLAFSPWYTRDRSDPYPVLLERLPKAR